jgi:hypothetical protein
LHALANGIDGGNGVYQYGSTGFPTSSFNASNYWVDVVFATTVPPDTTPPTVVGVTPADGAVDVAVDASATVVFSEAMDPATISSSTIELQDEGGNLVAAAVSYDAGTQTATLTPSSALGNSATYTATVLGGGTDPRVKDLAGNALVSDYSWSFSTAALSLYNTIWDATATPSITSANDTNAIEVGVKFRSDVAGYITGIRFYKGDLNTGTHIGNLWDSSGQLLESATFVNESASGWQQVDFTSPVPINADTTYVASYYAPVGGYATDGGYFSAAGVDNPPLHALADGVDGGNGVYQYGSTGFPTSSFNASNYWVDVVFTTAP